VCLIGHYKVRRIEVRESAVKTCLPVAFLLVIVSSAVARVIYVDAHRCTDDDTIQSAATAHVGAIIIDHNCVDLSAIPGDWLAHAASLRVLMRHASVGQGIEWGLDCLAGNHPTNQACSGFVAGTYDRSNWVFELRGGNWQAKVDDLVSQVALRADDFDVFMTKLCYIDALGSNHPDWEYFRSRMEQLEADYSEKKSVWWTIPLTRDGQPGTDVFNALMRSYCAANNKILFDIADIECHDPDGTKLTNAAGNEVISQNYTKEIHAGHLNIQGRVRVASAFWHLMARLAGWQKVYRTIQAAIDDANDGDVIIVKPGTYTGPGNRDIDFKGKAIIVRSTDPNDPNIIAATIIDCNGTQVDPHRGFKFVSGEDGDSVLAGLTITNGYAPEELFDMIPSEYHSAGGAIFCYRSRPTVTMCSILGNVAQSPGSFPGEYIGMGGGICCWWASPTISKCSISYNSAADSGGGIYSESSIATIVDCNISYNSSPRGGGIECDGSYDQCAVTMTHCNILANWGGGIRCDGLLCNQTINNCNISGNSQGSGIFCVNPFAATHKMTPTIRNCTISGNSRAGVYCYNRGSDPIITNCIITGNLGRGVLCSDGSPTITNCVISANSTYGIHHEGGGILCSGKHCEPIVNNCTIVANSASSRGGGICSSTGSSPTIINSVLWNNIADTGPQIALSTNLYHTYLTISHSDVQAGRSAVHVGIDCTLFWGQGNMDADPCFADHGYWDPNGTPEDANDDFWVDGDYHLRSQAGRWDANEGQWKKDDVTSPCIDAGDPMNPIGHEPFPNGGIINMGAYGGTAEASKSYFGEPVCETIVAGDINGDCKVDFADFELMALNWLEDNR